MPTLGPIIIVNEDNSSYSWCRIELNDEGVIQCVELADANMKGTFPSQAQFKQLNTNYPTKFRVIQDFSLTDDDIYKTYILSQGNDNRLYRIRFKPPMAGGVVAWLSPNKYNRNLWVNPTQEQLLSGRDKQTFKIKDQDAAPLVCDQFIEHRTAFVRQYQSEQARLTAQLEEKEKERKRNLRTLLVDVSVDGDLHGASADYRSTLRASGLMKAWIDIKELAMSNGEQPDWLYSYALAGMLYGTNVERRTEKTVDLDAQFPLFRDYLIKREHTTQEQSDFIRSLLVLEFLQSSQNHQDKPIDEPGIVKYITQKVARLNSEEHDVLYYQDTSKCEQVCTLLKMIGLLQDSEKKQRLYHDLCHIKLHHSLIESYPFNPEQRRWLYQHSIISDDERMNQQLNSCLLGRVILEQLAYLERGTQSLSPYWRGSHDKLNQANELLHQLLDPLEPQANVTEALTHALFDPQHRPLYDVFAKQRLSWFTHADYPTRTVMKIYFAYVNAELKPLEDQESVSKLIKRINALEQASHTYWPWNYGSQHKLHSILQAIITLKQNKVELNNDTLQPVIAIR